MKIQFDNCFLDDNESIVNTNSDSNVELNNTHINGIHQHAFILSANSSFSAKDSSIKNVSGSVIQENSITAIDLLDLLGLPKDTDIENLKQLLNSLATEKPENRLATIHESFISNLNNYSTIATNLINLMNQFNIQF